MRKIILIFIVALNTNVSYAIVTNDIVGGCDNAYLTPMDNTAHMRAVFAPNEHTCAPGYYLPANVDACVACPTGHNCPGGTYTFNKNVAQGITYNTITQNIPYGCNELLSANGAMFLRAKFEPNQIEIVWQDAAQSDVTANDARYVTYGTDIRTPANPPPHIPGKVFTGWKFIPAQ